MTEHNARHKVVVIGGGYAGTLAVDHLRTGAGVDITLVNARPGFHERVRLHRFEAGTGGATVDYGELLGGGIQLVDDSATRIDTAERVVQLASGRELRYDHVIYAVGSTPAIPRSVPGAVVFTHPIAAGTCVSVGRHAAMRQLARRDDTAVNLHLGGRLGAAIKELTCKVAVSRIRSEARRPGSTVRVKCGRRLERPASAARVVP